MEVFAMANVVEMNTNDRVMPVRLTDEKSGKGI